VKGLAVIAVIVAVMMVFAGLLAMHVMRLSGNL
jgi:hypothetical protein